jgi:hypothetical protein
VNKKCWRLRQTFNEIFNHIILSICKFIILSPRKIRDSLSGRISLWVRIYVVQTNWFDFSVLLIILGNCLVMMLDDPLNPGQFAVKPLNSILYQF